MANGCIDPQDRNEANLLMKELRRLDVAIALTSGSTAKRLVKQRAAIIVRLDKLSS